MVLLAGLLTLLSLSLRPVSAKDSDLMESILEVMHTLWDSIIPDLKKEENKAAKKVSFPYIQRSISACVKDKGSLCTVPSLCCST
jgi:hypothetical protein